MVAALIVFILAYIAIASEKFPRHWVALLGGGLLIVGGVMTLDEALNYISWDTLGLLAGMFFLVSILQEAGFFAWLAMNAVRRVNYHPGALSAILILLAAFLSMWMDSITVMLFLTALTIQLCRLLKLDPIPLIIAEVCAANTGGAGSMVGDPPNVIMGTTLGFNFMDFLTHTGPISLIGALVLLGVFFLVNHRALKEAHAVLTPEIINEIEQLHSEPLHAHLTRTGLSGFLMAVFLLIFHLPLSEASGLPITAALAALIPAGIALIALRDDQRKKAFLRVDGESILFFAGLFILIGGLEKVRLFESMATLLSNLARTNANLLVVSMHWIPGLLSGVLDNVPLALAMSYVLKDLTRLPGMPALGLMVWAAALGLDIGGNLTPIGASANVVAYAYTEQHYSNIGWKRWLTAAVPATLLVMLVATVLILLKSAIGWY